MSMYGPAFPMPGTPKLNPPFGDGSVGNFSTPGMSYKEWMFGMLMAEFFGRLGERKNMLAHVLDNQTLDGEIEAAIDVAIVCVNKAASKGSVLG